MMNKREFKLKFVIAASVLAAFSLILCNVSCSDHLSLLEELPPSTPSAKTYTITVTNAWYGTVSVDKKSAAAGETVKISVTPETGYVLAALSVTDESGKEIECTDNTFKMPESDVTVNGTFKLSTPPSAKTYTITVTGAEHGTVSVDKNNAAAGETVKISVTPETGYALAALSVTDESGKEIECTDNTFIMPESNVTVSGTFEVSTPPSAKTYTITVPYTLYGKVSVDKNTAAAGETVKISVTPDTGYVLAALTVTDGSVNEIACTDNTFIMPDSNVTVKASFETLSKLFNKILRNNLYAETSATKFIHSTTPPSESVTTYKLPADDGKVDVIAWLDGTTIYFYAKGFTDSNKKIPLNSDSSWLFSYCRSLQEIEIEFFDTSNVTDMTLMFFSCSALATLDLSSFKTSNVTNMGSMFGFCEGLTSLDLSSFDTSKVRNMSEMFEYCEGLTSLNLSSFNTSNVEMMSEMFYNCKGLTTLDLSHFNTSRVYSIYGMFKGCSSLVTLDLSSFDTSHVTDDRLSSWNSGFTQMFDDCSSLTTIKVSDNFVVENVTDSKYMFSGCDSLKGGAGTTYHYSNPKDKTYARIDGENGLKGYFTRGN